MKRHFMPKGNVMRSACGIFVYWEQDMTDDPMKVTCGNCGKAKVTRKALKDSRS